jgi:hypothetical protein
MLTLIHSRGLTFIEVDCIRELVTWQCKEHGVNIMNVLANLKESVRSLEYEFLEA